jgi:hypothetical protein
VIAVDGDGLAEDLDLAVGGVRGERVHLALQDLDEGIPLLAAEIELLEGGHRVGVAGIAALDLLPRVDGPIGGAAFGSGAGQLDGEERLLLGVRARALRVGEDGDELRVLPRRLQELTVEAQHRRVRGVHLAEAREEGLGGLGRVAEAPVHHAHLEEDPRLVLQLVTRAQRVFVERDQVVPLLLAGEVLDEKAHAFLVPRGEVEDPLVASRRALGLLEPSGDHPRGLEIELDAILLGSRLLRGVEEDGRELVPLLALAEHQAIEPRGPCIARVAVEGLAKEPIDVLVATPLLVLVDEDGRAHEERGLQRRLARALGLVDEPLGDLLPVRRRVLELLDGLGRLIVAGAQLLAGPVRDERSLVVEELLAVQLGEALQELRAGIGIARVIDLDRHERGRRLVLSTALVLLTGEPEQAKAVRTGPRGVTARDRVAQIADRLRVVGVLLQGSEKVRDGQHAVRPLWFVVGLRAGASARARREKMSSVRGSSWSPASRIVHAKNMHETKHLPHVERATRRMVRTCGG